MKFEDLKPGMVVKHPVYGLGSVINVYTGSAEIKFKDSTLFISQAGAEYLSIPGEEKSTEAEEAVAEKKARRRQSE